MEKLKKIIKLCEEHNIDLSSIGESYRMRKNKIHLCHLPKYGNLEKIKFDLEKYREKDFEFDLNSGKLEMFTWIFDHHRGTQEYIEKSYIDLSEEQKRDLIISLEKFYEKKLKSKLREEIIQEFTNKKYDELMGIINFQ